MKLCLSLLILTLICGCKRPDSTPELKDPIYGDLVKQFEEANRDVDALHRDLDAAKKTCAEADQQNGEVKARRNSVFEIMGRVDRAEQKKKFLELEIDSRKEFARKAYQKAFDKDQEWPAPEEFQFYQANQRLVKSPKNYEETHKRRLQERAPAAPPKKEEAKPAAHE